MNRFARIALATLAFALAFCLASCLPAGETSAETEAQAANREYMSQLNLFASEMDETLVGFADAVKSEDTAGMHEAVEKAASLVDELESLEAPEALADVAEGYAEGARDLQEALEAMVAVYDKAAEDGAYLASPEGKRALEDAQKLYDEGLAALQAADEAAAEKK